MSKNNNRNKMRNLFLILIILAIVSGCNSPKRIYKNVCIGVPKHFQEEVLKKNSATDSSYSLLYFTENFTNDKVSVSNDKTVLFEGYISSDEGLGFTSVIRIDNSLATNIFFENQNYRFKIEKSKYKFVYLNKTGKNKFVIKYSDCFCGFR